MDVTRRQVLKAGVAAGALLAVSPQRLFATGSTGGGIASFPTARSSRLFPGGQFVVHADLHNHTRLSDGAAAADKAFELLRTNRLDVAALTDHAVFGDAVARLNAVCGCSSTLGIREEDWRTLNQLAEQHNADGEFVAMRGFEWTTGTIGHVNVWFTERWIDAFTTGGLQSNKGLPVLLGTLPEPGPSLQRQIGPVFDQLPESATIDVFYEWLQSAKDRPGLGGGADGIAGFNHPNQYGDFHGFKFEPGLRQRMVSCEVFNGHDDFLFYGADEGRQSPINACLNAGWQVGMLGVSDEHGQAWGEGKGRAGLWVTELTRAGVREAMEQRRFFATHEPGLRLDATANGARMGSVLPHGSGPVRFVLDVDRGCHWYGRPMHVQILRPGDTAPVLAATIDVTLPADSDPLITFDVDIDANDGSWVLLRVTDPASPPDTRAPAGFRAHGGALAYASPWWLTAPD